MGDAAEPAFAAAAAEQAVPAEDKMAALERELEETKAEVKEAKLKVEQAERKVQEAGRSVEEPGASDISPYLKGLSPKTRRAELESRRKEVVRCTTLLEAQIGLLKSLNERLALLQSQNRAGVPGASGSDVQLLRADNARLLARLEALEGQPDEDLDAFWSALPQAVFSGRLLQLADGTVFLGTAKLSNKLYIREDYVGMWDEVKSSVDSGITGLVITGNPGIGKSRFGLFILYQISKLNVCETVVWEATQSRTRYLFRRGQKALQGGLDSFVELLRNKSVWYLVDEPGSPGPTICNAVTLVLSSPKRSNYNKFLNSVGATIRYMPTWGWSEIAECRELLNAGDTTRSAEIIQNAFDRWGGIPRHVLEKVGDPGWQSLLDDAISKVGNVNDLVRMDQIAATEETSHRLLHMRSEAPYVGYTFMLGSSFICTSLYEKFTSDQRFIVESLLSITSKDTGLSKIRGQFFETYCHRLLANGGTFDIRCLESGDETTIVLEASSSRYFSNNVELGSLLQSGCLDYLVPRNINYPAIDAVSVKPCLLLQMTVGPSHGVNVAGLGAVVKVLDNWMGTQSASPYDLVVVVPSDLYHGFRSQRYEFPKGKSYRDFASILDRVSQKVLKLPAPRTVITRQS